MVDKARASLLTKMAHGHEPRDVKIEEAFDRPLWKAGVEDGAFAEIRDGGARWYVMETDGVKFAIGSAIPGPGELTTVSYYVAPDYRNQGYGTKLARYITDRHEKASFLINKDNEASVKVALAALRNKFAATMGRHYVRLTKEAAEEGEKKQPSYKKHIAAAVGAAATQPVSEKMFRLSARMSKPMTSAEMRFADKALGGAGIIERSPFASVGEEATLYLPELKESVVALSKKTPLDIAMHEVGHAKTLRAPVLGKALRAPRVAEEVLGRAPFSAKAVAAGTAAAAIAADPDSVVAKAVPYVAAAMAPGAGHLPEEIAASTYGIGKMLLGGYVAGSAKGVGRLGLALGTYAAPAAAVGLSAELLRRYLSRKRQEKKAAEGGLAKGKPDSDFDPEALAQGQKVEMEHTNDPKKARQIAKDHLTEFPTYYTELKKMEKKLDEKKGADVQAAREHLKAAMGQLRREKMIAKSSAALAAMTMIMGTLASMARKATQEAPSHMNFDPATGMMW